MNHRSVKVQKRKQNRMETLIDHINKDNKKHEMPCPISASGARSAGGVQKNEVGFRVLDRWECWAGNPVDAASHYIAWPKCFY